ncbi:serine protease 23-like [Pecten maximus]|uniref:serine protease 23-like n=1 Tax=Pecten maximus TaxID=6579 RepID=UPI00145801BB|nr:serine protease 23-like [Pecten maximus]XP_033746386.1 serine protease 23-like [Pecten maximus]
MLYTCAYSYLLYLVYVWLSFYLHAVVLSAGVGDTVRRRLSNASVSKNLKQYVMQSSSHVFHFSDSPKKRTHEWTNGYFRRTKSSNRLQLLNALESNVLFDGADKRSPPRQQRVFVYGHDDRLAIDPSRVKHYPYFNIVRLLGSGVGCTGTLLTPTYVLTAAHCVHDGDAFKPKLGMLKVFIPHSHGDLVRFISNISVPSQWGKAGANAKRAKFDYAVLHLNLAVYGRHDFMPLHVPSQRLINEDLYFLGFHYDTASMSKTKCSESLKHLMYGNNVLLSQCDSSVGNSGATLFYENPRTRERKIIGLVSNTADLSWRKSNRWYRVTYITLLTPDKIKDICDMVFPEGREYNVCPPFTYRKYSRESMMW